MCRRHRVCMRDANWISVSHARQHTQHIRVRQRDSGVFGKAWLSRVKTFGQTHARIRQNSVIFFGFCFIVFVVNDLHFTKALPFIQLLRSFVAIDDHTHSHECLIDNGTMEHSNLLVCLSFFFFFSFLGVSVCWCDFLRSILYENFQSFLLAYLSLWHVALFHSI